MFISTISDYVYGMSFDEFLLLSDVLDLPECVGLVDRGGMTPSELDTVRQVLIDQYNVPADYVSGDYLRFFLHFIVNRFLSGK